MNHAFLLAAVAAGLSTSVAMAQRAPAPLKPTEVLVQLESMRTWHVTTLGRVLHDDIRRYTPTDGCNILRSHTDANFGGGQFVLQQGFAEKEVLAASYVLPASEFPIRVDLCEWVVAAQTTVPTTTKWSVLIYDGVPTTGVLVAEYSSDDFLLPHIQLPPGTSGVNLQFSVDPGDPEQIIVSNITGQNTVTLAWRIDDHHNGPGNPCNTIPTNSNAFPTTDVSGLAAPTGNWLNAIDCGPFGCPPGWKRFSEMITLCKPSGDWVTRLTYSSLNCQPGVGACCLLTGCEVLLQADCLAQGGTYKGDGTTCELAGCPTPTVPCCFAATGGCLNLSVQDCNNAGGVAGPLGVLCSQHVCFPKGACCLPDGSCAGDKTPEECALLGGTFQGNATTCATTTCPEPKGACCFGNGFCLLLTEAECDAAGAAWFGLGSDCTDTNGNGKADACEPSCRPDCEEDGDLDVFDFLCFQNKFSVQDPYGDYEEDGDWDIFDFLAYQNGYATGC